MNAHLPKSTYELVHRWHVRTSAIEAAHFKRCAQLRQRHWVFGITLIVTSSLLGAVANFKGDSHVLPPELIRELSIILSMFVPVWSAVVTFLGYNERSSKHHDAAARFAALKRQLQIAQANCESSKLCDQVPIILEEVRKRWDELTLGAPELTKKEWPEIQAGDEVINEMK